MCVLLVSPTSLRSTRRRRAETNGSSWEFRTTSNASSAVQSRCRATPCSPDDSKTALIRGRSLADESSALRGRLDVRPAAGRADSAGVVASQPSSARRAQDRGGSVPPSGGIAEHREQQRRVWLHTMCESRRKIAIRRFVQIRPTGQVFGQPLVLGGDDRHPLRQAPDSYAAELTVLDLILDGDCCRWSLSRVSGTSATVDGWREFEQRLCPIDRCCAGCDGGRHIVAFPVCERALFAAVHVERAHTGIVGDVLARVCSTSRRIAPLRFGRG